MESILSLIKVEEVADKVGACGAQQQHSHFGVDIDVVYVVLSVALAHNVAAALVPILVQLHQGIGAANGSMAIQGAQLFQGGRAVGVAQVLHPLAGQSAMETAKEYQLMGIWLSSLLYIYIQIILR